MTLNYVDLTGTLPGAGGTRVVFTPAGWLTDPTDELLLPPVPVAVTLANATVNGIACGTFAASLLATDNANPVPSGWTWEAQFLGIPGVAEETFSFFLPYANGATQDISTLAQVPSVTPTAAYLPLSSGTPVAGQVPKATGAGQSSAWGYVSGQYLCPPTAYAPASATTYSTTSTTLSAVNSASINTGAFTAPPSGSVQVTVSAVVSISAASVGYSFSLGQHGSVTPACYSYTTQESSLSTRPLKTMTFMVSGLTPGSSYTLDLLYAVAGAGGNTLSVIALGSMSTTPTGTIGGPVTMTVQAV